MGWIHSASACDAKTVYADFVRTVKDDVATFQAVVGHSVSVSVDDERLYAIKYGLFVCSVQMVPTPKDDIVVARRYRLEADEDDVLMEIRAVVDQVGQRLLDVRTDGRYTLTFEQTARRLLQPMLFADVKNAS